MMFKGKTIRPGSFGPYKPYAGFVYKVGDRKQNA